MREGIRGTKEGGAYKRIAIYATLPPPYGGVSVHVERLIGVAEEECIPVKLYDWRKSGNTIKNYTYAGPTLSRIINVFYFLFKFKEPAIHFHNNGVSTLIPAIFIASFRGKHVFLTIHGEKLIQEYKKCSVVRRFLLKKALSRCDHLFCVSSSIAKWAAALGCSFSSISLSPAFIKPTRDQISEENLSDEMKKFLRSHSPIIGTHGWFGSFVGGKHVYSFELIAEMAVQIRKKFPNCGIYTVVSGNYSEKHREDIFLKRQQNELDKDWMIIEEPFHAASLFSRSDLFIRPTITDGDSVSVRECLSLGVPVIASDAVFRPEGCVLFRNLDLSDLMEKAQEVLGNLSLYKEKVQDIQIGDASEEVLAVYKEVLSSFQS